MKKIYWQVQQVNRIGGAEMVTIDLANHLSKEYDITLVSTVKIVGEIPYHLEPTLKVMSLNIPKRTERVDILTKKYLKYCRFISLLILYLEIFYYYLLKLKIYHRKLQKLLLKDDATLICSAVDGYMLAPKKGRVFYHFHFASNVFFRADNYPIFKLYRKPDKWIFLTEYTRNVICEKLPELKENSVAIHNPVRFKRVLDTSYHNNTIIFAGRFNSVKNPMLALEVANELNNRKFPFLLRMFGDPIMKKEMDEYIKEHKLQDVVELHEASTSIEKEIIESDLLLLTSVHEGFCLVLAEANVFSRPWVSSNWSPAIDEIYEDGKAGIIIRDNDPKKFADAIMEILSNKEHLVEMKKSAYEASASLSIDNILPEWRKILG